MYHMYDGLFFLGELLFLALLFKGIARWLSWELHKGDHLPKHPENS